MSETGPPPGTTEPPETPLRILVVEDDAIIQFLTCEVLTAMGHEVCGVAATQAEAVAVAAATKPDVMVVDSHLGAGSGVKAVRQILLVRQIPHIFVSGDPLVAYPSDTGAVILQKPYQERDLARAIVEAIGAAPR